jgi:hypothetical protein
MPNSFSRFLNDEELQKVRELYLQSLQDAEQEHGTGAADEIPGEDPVASGGPASAES